MSCWLARTSAITRPHADQAALAERLFQELESFLAGPSFPASKCGISKPCPLPAALIPAVSGISVSFLTVAGKKSLRSPPPFGRIAALLELRTIGCNTPIAAGSSGKFLTLP